MRWKLVSGSKTIDIPAGEPFSIGREHLPEYYEPHASCDNGSCHVSREQLRILASTSSAKITAVGLNKIGHRSAARYAPLEWQYLSRGESFEVFCGCRILLDSRQEATSQIELVSVEDQEKSGASGEIRRTTSNKRPREAENTAPTLPFRRGNIYLNLLPGEVRTPRHVNWLDLLPMDCTCALFTSLFPKESYDWLRQVCPDLKRALVVADRCIKPKPNPPPTLTSPRNDEWLLLEGARTGGNFHCSLILFRTPNYLRVALGGTNLEGQMEKDRDSLFVQDFPLKSDYEGGSRRRDYNDDDDNESDDDQLPRDDYQTSSPHFGGRLSSFLDYIAAQPFPVPLPSNDQRRVRQRNAELLDGVDFSSATDAALLTCMPGGPSGLDKGGWKQLDLSMRQIGAPQTHGGRIDIATGHFGAISLPFLQTMTTTLRRSPPQASNELDAIGTTFLYHSSRKTVLAPQTNAFAVLRTTAPGNRAEASTDETLLKRYFHDALPKFERRGDKEGSEALTPILHGKALLATSADGTGGVLVVGSQNFSQASWGMRNNQPTNVEIGVVMKASGLEAVEELKARFPITLAPLAEFRTLDTERGYVMARGPTDGDNSMQGLQMRWRMRCNKDRPDDEELPAWRLFLHRWWRMCSSCRETLPGRSEGSAANVKEMEAAAWKREAFLCASCRGD